MTSGQNSIVAAERTRNVKYAIRDIVVLADKVKSKGRDVLYLNIGDPIKYDFSTPGHIVDAIHKGMLEGDTGYGPSQGVEEAVEAIEREAARLGIEHVNQICVTTGASEGIELALTALVNPGENVLLPSPGYPLYSAVMSKLDGKVNPYFLDEDNGWQPDVADMEAKVNDKTRAVVVINPNNPTGSIADKNTLKEIVELAKRHNLVILADEIYDKILFDGVSHTSLGAVAGEHPCVTFNGLSKSYIGPGLRTGWAIVSGDPEMTADFTDAFMKMARARLCSNTPMQWGVRPALEGDQSHLADMIRRLKVRTDLVVSRINAIEGFRCIEPKGAFYVFPTIQDKDSDWDFVTALLEQTGVVTVPGSGFGQRPGTKHLRIVLLPPEEILSRAMDHLEDFVKSRR
ncbi:MAG: aminotransferase class I/II-fold pyridoxal phosphate-dependent enzyme [Proteobacteria bacterium]|nr:aminotransferase class I/II-fold pyridoxal phosphate-dependent enzyme [Pseudomonadota bacterium]